MRRITHTPRGIRARAESTDFLWPARKYLKNVFSVLFLVRGLTNFLISLTFLCHHIAKKEGQNN